MVLVIVLCGIPGAGKSTTAHVLRNTLELSGIQCNSIVYDELASDVVWDDSSFAKVRDTGHERLQSSLEQSRSMICDSKRSVIIVDDLMYLRSMRREIYQVCRDNGAHLLVLWVDSDKEISWERNCARQGSSCIPLESFNRIVDSFQPPNVDHICDRNNFHLVTSPDRDSSIEISRLVSMINSILEWDPPTDPQVIMAKRDTVPQNGVGKVDKVVRKIVSTAISRIRELGLDPSVVKEAGKCMTGLKAGVLQRARTSEDPNLLSLLENEESGEYSSLEKLVLELMRCELDHRQSSIPTEMWALLSANVCIP